ncbi:hypothetical protein [Streptomyces soliscabiei]|uniref:hypothetical protein n=1 Tax=Streptomyces soliscabiei TaxID=588897 RepID=UPI0029A91B7E|nr:hypothetical protein [Streptomyces sp. NY05-11A]MDX2675389.1 hypothetical protein [Streptomyces sp. NY05-11A]
MTTPHDAPGVHSVIGVDAGTASLREADHLIHHLVDRLGLPPGTIACTHLIRTDDRRGTAISLALPGADASEAAWQQLAGLDGPEGVGAALGELRMGPTEAARTAAQAAAEHAHRRSGRAVVYPGVENLTGTVTVTDLLAQTAIDQLTVVGAPPADGKGPDPATPVLTRDHVRPEWRDGQLTLALVPAAGGTLAPFEVPNPTPCCADHA